MSPRVVMMRFMTLHPSSRDRGQSGVGPMIGVAIGVVVVLIIGYFALNTWSTTDAASAGCVYNGGWFDNSSYRDAVRPGAGRESQGIQSSVVEYPIGIVQLDSSDGLTPIEVSVGGFTLTYNPVISMTIASFPAAVEGKELKTGALADGDKPQACNLIEQHLRRLKATDFNDDDSRWVSQFLLPRVGNPIKDVLPRVLSNGDVSAQFLNTDGARDKAAVRAGQLLTETLRTSIGDDYFCSTTYRYGQPREACGYINVVLPEPIIADDDLAIIRAPQEARTRANNEIAVATEAARAAREVAAQKTEEAKSAKERADAEQSIAQEQARVDRARAVLDYAWCEYLVGLDQSCWLTIAAQNGNLPAVLGGDANVTVPIEPAAPTTTTTPPATTAPAP